MATAIHDVLYAIVATYYEQLPQKPLAIEATYISNSAPIIIVALIYQISLLQPLIKH